MESYKNWGHLPAPCYFKWEIWRFWATTQKLDFPFNINVYSKCITYLWHSFDGPPTVYLNIITLGTAMPVPADVGLNLVTISSTARHQNPEDLSPI